MISSGTPFQFKDVGAPDAWRVPIYRGRGHGTLIAYATGGTEAEAVSNAVLILKAFNPPAP